MDQPPTSTHRLADAEAERLWRAWTDHRDVRARDRLILSFSPMVKYLATRKIRELPPHCDLEDLVSCGLLALFGAIDRYEPSKGATFEQYAWTRVSGAILDELRSQDWAPRSLRRWGRAIDEARVDWQEHTGAVPTDHELAAMLDIPLSELQEQKQRLARADIASLDAPTLSDQGDPISLVDTIEAPIGMDDPEVAALASDRAQMLRSALTCLPDREQTVLRLAYIEQRSGEEIGEILGVGASRVSQLIAKSRHALKLRIDRYERESLAPAA
jgi:RNA polymerase sigma factor FliA